MDFKEKNELINVVFEVEKIIHRNEENGYTVMKANFKEYPSEYIPTREIIVVCSYLGGITEEDEFKGQGKWVYKQTYGHQFHMVDMELHIPVTIKGIQEYLSRRLKGVQKKTIEKIINAYQESSIEKIVEDLDNLINIGVRKATATKIHEKIKEDYMFENIYPFLRSHQVPNKQMISIYEALGENTKRKILENPYCICSIPKISFLTADKIAFNIGTPFNNNERIKHGILYYIENQMKNQGHLFIYKTALQKELASFLSIIKTYSNEEAISTKVIDTALAELVQENKIIISLAEDSEGYSTECIYLRFYYNLENKIVSLLKDILVEKKAPICTKSDIRDFITEYEQTTQVRLAMKQKEAVYMALLNGFSILTGGPGTGKTQTINTVLKCIESVNPSATVKLCAPTGRASKRMTELCGISAQTIHRLIGLNGFEEEIELNEVTADILIVDEGSMIDAYVFYKLLSAISNNTRILLVGDYDQLPSVGPGLILRDLINSGRIPVTILNEIFRQAGKSQIVTNSHKVISGITTTDVNGIAFDKDKDDFFFIKKNDPINIRESLIQGVSNLINNKGFSLDEIQVLTVMNKGDLGVDAINQKMQERFNPQTQDKGEIKTGVTTLLRVGDKVIQTVNNYDLSVFNGEVGKIIDILIMENDYEITVDFEDKTIIYTPEFSHELSLAYVITVHKSQGSEFPVVVMPIHSSLKILLNRNIVYTGLTRAKKKVALFGSIKEFDKAIMQIDNTIRNSLIKSKIQKEIPEKVVC